MAPRPNQTGQDQRLVAPGQRPAGHWVRPATEPEQGEGQGRAQTRDAGFMMSSLSMPPLHACFVAKSVPPDYLFCSRVWQRVAGGKRTEEEALRKQGGEAESGWRHPTGQGLERVMLGQAHGCPSKQSSSGCSSLCRPLLPFVAREGICFLAFCFWAPLLSAARPGSKRVRSVQSREPLLGQAGIEHSFDFFQQGRLPG